jgi:hypothetical protein
MLSFKEMKIKAPDKIFFILSGAERAHFHGFFHREPPDKKTQWIEFNHD